jgi:hypothetical protein
MKIEKSFLTDVATETVTPVDMDLAAARQRVIKHRGSLKMSARSQPPFQRERCWLALLCGERGRSTFSTSKRHTQERGCRNSPVLSRRRNYRK